MVVGWVFVDVPISNEVGPPGSRTRAAARSVPVRSADDGVESGGLETLDAIGALSSPMKTGLSICSAQPDSRANDCQYFFPMDAYELCVESALWLT